MKVVDYIDHPDYKITIFKSGFKHIVKFDRGDINFSFKFLDGEVQGLAALHDLVKVHLIPSADDHYLRLKASKRRSIDASDVDEGDMEFPTIV